MEGSDLWPGSTWYTRHQRSCNMPTEIVLRGCESRLAELCCYLRTWSWWWWLEVRHGFYSTTSLIHLHLDVWAVYALYNQNLMLGISLSIWFLLCRIYNAWILLFVPQTMKTNTFCITEKRVRQPKPLVWVLLRAFALQVYNSSWQCDHNLQPVFPLGVDILEILSDPSTSTAGKVYQRAQDSGCYSGHER
jgi:hypothetical protein